MTTTEWPSAAITRSVRKSSCASCGVNTAVGSSRISTREPLLTALMISTRCCSPTESCQIFAPGSTGMWSASAVSSTCRAASRPRSRNGAVRSASAMFSATVSVSTRRKCWCTIPMPASIASRGE